MIYCLSVKEMQISKSSTAKGQLGCKEETFHCDSQSKLAKKECIADIVVKSPKSEKSIGITVC